MIKRYATKILEKYLMNGGATLIVGPKFCGKTFLAKQFAQSTIFIDTSLSADVNFAKDYILSGASPRLIDEWQHFPKVWDYVRHNIDDRPLGNKLGLYILTGSSSPLGKEEVQHSGSGRILKMQLFTLSMAEILDLPNDQSISLEELFNTKTLKYVGNPLNNDEVNHYMFIGGWPQIIQEKISDPTLLIKSYVSSISNSQTKKYYDLVINKDVLNNILISISRRVGTQIEKSNILNDLKNSLSPITLDKYLQMFYEMELLYQLPAWNNINVRSTYRLKTKPKIYLCDTSLFCSIMNYKSSMDFYDDLNTTGIVYENLVIKDLMVYAQMLDAKLSFYRDEKGNEIDAILEMSDGRWAAIEIKLSLEGALKAAARLEHTLQTLKMEGKYKEPTFKMIICNCDKSFVTDNGVFIVPHTILKP